MKYVVAEYGKLAEENERTKRMLGRMKDRLKAVEGAAK